MNPASGKEEPRDRYSLYRLCVCDVCEGTGKEGEARCPICRGEGRIRDEVATCNTAASVGVALVTLGREGEWFDEDGQPCAIGLLDRKGEKGKKWLILPWHPSPRNVRDAGKVLASASVRKRERREDQ